ncbi:MAG: heme o synthase [Bacteroidota bacterium]
MEAISINMNLAQRLKAYAVLFKARLSALVVFSSAFGYVLGMEHFSFSSFALFCLGGFLISGCSSILNQIKESQFDALMKRTSERPIPAGIISKTEAFNLSIVSGVLGVILVYTSTNFLATSLSLISFILYAFVYTPLKRVGPIAVFVGAIPGALPPLIGWVAATNAISAEALVIFGIQFIWQFPHFWAIAWVSDEDYKRAGFQLLPYKGKKDMNTAVNIMVYTLFLIPLGLLPAKFGISGINSAIVATVCGVLFLAQTFKLMHKCTDKAALKIMFGSFLYLPIIQIAYVLDKV